MVEAVRRRADEPHAVRVDRPCHPDHRRAHRRGVDPVPRDVDARELSSRLVVAERTERPPDVGELERAKDDQEGDEHAGEEVVGADLVVGEAVGEAGQDEARLDPVRSRCPRSRLANASENTSVTTPVKMTPSTPHRDPAQQSADDRALAVPTATPATTGSVVLSERMAAP